MGVATSTGNHSNSTSPHRNKAPTRLVTGPSKNWFFTHFRGMLA